MRSATSPAAREAARTFIATDDFTVADILMTHVVSGGTDQKLLARCTKRPACKRTVAASCERAEAA